MSLSLQFHSHHVRFFGPVALKPTSAAGLSSSSTQSSGSGPNLRPGHLPCNVMEFDLEIKRYQCGIE